MMLPVRLPARLPACLFALAFAVLAPLFAGPLAAQPTAAARYVSPLQQQVEGSAIAAYGPFRVLDQQTAALVGIIDSRSVPAFRAMLAAYPQLAVLEFVEAPGTHNDLANLALGRIIRERGLATVVENGGSVRSGGVELFLAGVQRSIAPGAEFAVHGWLDDHGRGVQDYPAHAPEHRRYLDYYTEMGMTPAQAADFYAMTNSVPFHEALWLTGQEMRGWLEEAGLAQNWPEAGPEAGHVESCARPERPAPRLAYLELAYLDLAPVVP